MGSASYSSTCGGSAGTQTSCGYGSTRNSATAGSFGTGGKGYAVSSSSGGGRRRLVWRPEVEIVAEAGGGSGYVYTSSTASNYPSGCLLNSSYYLTSALTSAGDSTFKNPSGVNEIGHTGDGYVRITPTT